MTLSLRATYQHQLAKLAYRHGLTFARQGSHVKAIATFTQAIEKGFSPCAQAIVMRGISRAQSQDADGAIADFETVIESPDSTGHSTIHSTGRSTIDSARDFVGALGPETALCAKDAERETEAVALNRPLAQAHYHRGLLRQYAGDEAGALTDWSTAIAHWPTYPAPHYHRALLRLSQGLLEPAREDLDAAIAANQSFAAAYALRGNLRHQTGDIPGAVADWELAVCNDFTLEEAKQKLAAVQQATVDERLSTLLTKALTGKRLTVEVNYRDAQLDIHIHREVGVGVNYYTLPDLIREQLVPLQLSGVSRFQLIGHVAGVNRSEWSQTYDVYKGQPCPPSNWESALSTLILFPPFGIPAFIQAAKVKPLYQRGRYLEALSASKSVKGLCVAGGVTLGFFTLLPLGYVAFDSMRENPSFKMAGQSQESVHRPYQEIHKN